MDDRALERRYAGSRTLAGLMAGVVAGVVAAAITQDVLAHAARSNGRWADYLVPDALDWLGRLPLLVDLSRLFAYLHPDLPPLTGDGATNIGLAVGAAVTGLVVWWWFAEWARERRALLQARALAPPVRARDRDEGRRLTRRASYARRR